MPTVPGQNRVAVVLPTYTWQAYNFYDANGDGRPDSWYGDPKRHNVQLGRPYLNSGKPPHYRTNQRGFLRFLVHTGRQADYLTDEDLEQFASGDDLAKLYDLVIFSGHEEYVTQQIYDVVQRYRDLGGNLAFLSANNFFRHVVLSNEPPLARQALARRRSTRVGVDRRSVQRQRPRRPRRALHGGATGGRAVAVQRHPGCGGHAALSCALRHRVRRGDILLAAGDAAAGGGHTPDYEGPRSAGR